MYYKYTTFFAVNALPDEIKIQVCCIPASAYQNVKNKKHKYIYKNITTYTAPKLQKQNGRI